MRSQDAHMRRSQTDDRGGIMGDDWLVSENIDVNIQQLKDFAQAIQNELETNFRPSYQGGVLPMLQVQAPFGGGGMNEGRFFRGRHDESRLAVIRLLEDAMQGMVSLSTVSMSISADYLTEDALVEATNTDVLNAFSTVDGQQTLNNGVQQGDNEHGNSTDSLPPGAFGSTVTHLEQSVGLDGNTGEAPLMDQPETVGEGSGAYRIQGDDERMHGDEVTPPDVDLRG